MKVAIWLTENGFERFIDLFEENEIDEEVLYELTDADLAGLGVPLGPRKKIIKALHAAIHTGHDAGQDAGHNSQEPERSAPESTDETALAPSTAPANAHPTQGSAERRQLTVMFADLVGSTAMSGRLDVEDTRDVITAFQNQVTGIVTRYDGQVAKYMGDGVLCYFGWPRAHEDDGERAIRSGLGIINALSLLKTPDGQPLEARVGVATGLVVVGDLIGEGAAQEEAVIGETPNLAARMQGLAEPGQLVISEGTRNLLAGVFEFSDLGPQNLKGISGEVPAYLVTGKGTNESRFEAHASGVYGTMIGRDHELALMNARWEQAKAGEGQLLVLTGEAGIGKSRVTKAMIDTVEAEPHTHTRISFQCSPYHIDSSLHPIIQQLTFAADIKEADSNDEKLDKLESIVVGANAASLAAILGLETGPRYGTPDLSPQQQRTRMFQALVDEITIRAKDNPVLVVLEDAHWIDASSLEFLELCLDQIAVARVLILVTARPTFTHNFGGHFIVTSLSLNRLSRDHVASIIEKIAGGRTLPGELLDEIAAKTDGVPLFIEELTKTVLESGKLTKTETSYELSQPLSQLAIPATLHDSLMARLDRLQPVKEVAQTAACIGREFEYSLLESITSLKPETLGDALEQLIAAELLFKRGVLPDVLYTFKHALVRDAAYESLLKSRRTAIHSTLCEVLQREGKAPAELVAYHATCAGLTELAIELWAKAGNLAIAQPAYEEAISHFNQSLKLIDEMPEKGQWAERELELLVQVALALIAGHGYSSQRATDTFEKAAQNIAATDNPELRIAIYYGMWIGPYIRADMKTCMDLGSQIVAEVDQKDDPIPRIMAHRMYAASLITSGKSVEAQRELEISYSLYQKNMNPDFASKFAQEPGVQIQCYQMLSLWMSGFPDQALKVASEATKRARALSHANTMCYSGLHHTVLAAWSGDKDLLKLINDEVAEIAEEYGMVLWIIFFNILGSIQRLADDDDTAFAALDKAIEEYEATDGHLWVSFFMVKKSQELLRRDNLEEARKSLDRAREKIQTTAEHWIEPEIFRLYGEVDLAEGNKVSAYHSFERAVEVARAQQAKMLELRASVSLGKALANDGDSAKARALLQPIYDWFSEGHETLDLVQAKELLEQIA